MDVIENILGENEVGEFDEDDFGALYKVLNELTAWRIREYMQSPNAKPEVVANIEKHLGSSVHSLTLGKVMQEKGILDLVNSLNIGTIRTYAKNNPDCYKQLQYLRDNYDDIRFSNKPATANDFKNFQSTVVHVLSRMRQKNIPVTYEDVALRLKDNSFLFYSPHKTLRSTNVSTLHARKTTWQMCLKGLDFDHYCEEHGITNAQRRVF